MVQMASVDYVKTFFNWNEKALSSDIDHEKKHCRSNSLEQINDHLPTLHDTRSFNDKSLSSQQNELQNSTRSPEKAQFSIPEESLDQKEQCPQFGSTMMESGSSDELNLLMANWKFMTEDEQKSYYVWVKPSKIPNDWFNDPDDLQIFDIFYPSEKDDFIVSSFQILGLPIPRPILFNTDLFLLDGGNGKYYMWNEESDYVVELYERNLDNILSVLRTDAGCWGLVYRHIGTIGGPKEDPEEWRGPFPPFTLGFWTSRTVTEPYNRW